MERNGKKLEVDLLKTSCRTRTFDEVIKGGGLIEGEVSIRKK